MHEVLGLVDAIEAMVLEAKKIPMTNKVILEEDDVIKITDKIRQVIKGYRDMPRQTVSAEASHNLKNEADPTSESVIKQASEEAKEMIEGADQYADTLFANLQLMISKLQGQISRVEKTIESSRELIEQKKNKKG